MAHSQASLRCDGWKMHQRHTADNAEPAERNSHFNGSRVPPSLAASKHQRSPLLSPLRSSWIQRLRSSHPSGESQDRDAQDATDEDSRLVSHENSRKMGYGLGFDNYSYQLHRTSQREWPLAVGSDTRKGVTISSDRPPLQQSCFSQETRRGFDADGGPSHWPASEKSPGEPVTFVSTKLLPTVESLLPDVAKQGNKNFSACREPSSAFTSVKPYRGTMGAKQMLAVPAETTWNVRREVFDSCDVTAERTGIISHWKNLSKPRPLSNWPVRMGDVSKRLKERKQCYFNTNENVKNISINPTDNSLVDRCGRTSKTQTSHSLERCNIINTGLQLRGTGLPRQATEGSPFTAQIIRSNEAPREHLSSLHLVKRKGLASSSKLEYTDPQVYQAYGCSTSSRLGVHASYSERIGFESKVGRSLPAFEQDTHSSQGSQPEQPVGSVSFTFNFGKKELKVLPYADSVQINWPFSQDPVHEKPSSSSSSGSERLPCNTSALFCQTSSRFARARADTIVLSNSKQPKDFDSLSVNTHSKQILSPKHNIKALQTFFSGSGENAQLTDNKQTDIKVQPQGRTGPVSRHTHGVGVLSVGAPQAQKVKPNAGATASKSNIPADIRSGLVTSYLERAAACDPTPEWVRVGCVNKPRSPYNVVGAGGMNCAKQACLAASGEEDPCDGKRVRPAVKARLWIQRWCRVASARKHSGGVVELSEGVESNDRALAVLKREREEGYGDTGAGAEAQVAEEESNDDKLDMALAKRARADERPWGRMLCPVVETEAGIRASRHCSSSSSTLAMGSSVVGRGGRESHFLRRFFAPSAAAMAIIGTTARQVYAAQPEKGGLLGAWPSPHNFSSSAAAMTKVPMSEALMSKKGPPPLPPIEEPCGNSAPNRDSQVGA